MSTTPLDKDAPRPRGALDSGHRACQWNAHTHSLQTTWRAQCGSPNASSRAGLHSGKPWVWLAKRPADTGALSTPHAGQRLPAGGEQPLQSAQSTATYLGGPLSGRTEPRAQVELREEKLVAQASQEPEQRGTWVTRSCGATSRSPEGAESGWNTGQSKKHRGKSPES